MYRYLQTQRGAVPFVICKVEYIPPVMAVYFRPLNKVGICIYMCVYFIRIVCYVAYIWQFVCLFIYMLLSFVIAFIYFSLYYTHIRRYSYIICSYTCIHIHTFLPIPPPYTGRLQVHRGPIPLHELPAHLPLPVAPLHHILMRG